MCPGVDVVDVGWYRDQSSTARSFIHRTLNRTSRHWNRTKDRHDRALADSSSPKIKDNYYFSSFVFVFYLPF